jgi:hypothetical protein
MAGVRWSDPIGPEIGLPQGGEGNKFKSPLPLPLWGRGAGGEGVAKSAHLRVTCSKSQTIQSGPPPAAGLPPAFRITLASIPSRPRHSRASPRTLSLLLPLFVVKPPAVESPCAPKEVVVTAIKSIYRPWRSAFGSGLVLVISVSARRSGRIFVRADTLSIALRGT